MGSHGKLGREIGGLGLPTIGVISFIRHTKDGPDMACIWGNLFKSWACISLPGGGLWAGPDKEYPGQTTYTDLCTTTIIRTFTAP
jgi:hypothetical protein